jgi:ATP-dependent helicase/nuclease subunit B
LRKLAADARDSGGLPFKLQDLALLLESYSAWLNEHELQDVDCLMAAATAALKSEIGNRQSGIHALWLDGFAELSPQELDLLVALAPRCGNVTLAFCLDPEAKVDSWISHWAAVRKTVEECRKRLASVPGATIASEILSRQSSETRFSAPILAQVEQSWLNKEFTFSVSRFTPPAPLRFITCANPDAEAVFAAREILKFVRTRRSDGTPNRFRDAAILVRDLETYHEPLQRVFLRYEIPCFLDRRESVSHHPLAELSRSALRTLVYQWPHDDWFAALKTGLIPVEELEIDYLENEALARGWKGSAWMEPLQVENNPRLSERLESLRKMIVAPFKRLAAQLARNSPPPCAPFGMN